MPFHSRPPTRTLTVLSINPADTTTPWSSRKDRFAAAIICVAMASTVGALLLRSTKSATVPSQRHTGGTSRDGQRCLAVLLAGVTKKIGATAQSSADVWLVPPKIADGR